MNQVNLCGKIQRINNLQNVTYITLHCKDGKQSEFIDITIFQKEFFNKYFVHGMWCCVTGHIHINKHDNTYRTEIIADSIGFAGNKEQWQDIPLTEYEKDNLPFETNAPYDETDEMQLSC